jgi:hypothetical protein
MGECVLRGWSRLFVRLDMIEAQNGEFIDLDVHGMILSVKARLDKITQGQ